jgi:carbamoyltransferase
MIVGLSVDHDSSVAFFNYDGEVLWAASEERFSRRKGHTGFPFLALSRGLSDLNVTNPQTEISDVVVGTYGTMTRGRFINLFDDVFPSDFPQSNFGKTTDRKLPGKSNGEVFFEQRKLENSSAEELKQAIRTVFINLLKDRFGLSADVHFINHHDSHAASAFFASGADRALVLTMDGQGDGESMTVRLMERGSDLGFQKSHRVKAKDSLGHVYSAVTNRYGMKSNRHEGKILGLAALGKKSEAIKKIDDLIRIEEGLPVVTVPFKQELEQSLASISDLAGFYHSDYLELFFKSIDVEEFPDLAYAVQQVIEKKVLEIVDYWLNYYPCEHLAVAGGFFANVKVNQKIAEHVYPKKIYIYPNMGDGGLAVGGVWAWMHCNGKLISKSAHVSMLSGPFPTTFPGSELLDLRGLDTKQVDCEHSAVATLAKLISNGYHVGIVAGPMEFGPRALGNRSLLADPRNAAVNKSLNDRLNRTEYMPFAPICLAEKFHEVFDVSKHASIEPFKFMTMLCNVQESWREKIPAVVHADGTARPQIVTSSDYSFLHRLLSRYYQDTGVPCLVNTSFNLHEEPIIMSLHDALRALRADGCDVVYFTGMFYFLSGNREISSFFTD